ncbi:hypothetical protein NPIL_603931 [Nephila pilipes]|uniref:Uncharacterized protein n=1 Tax=Nephila pilipes TaxID=299642 RepID=A0A8X6U0G2_NEPPI|nr:hypothetical protein NPIL_603931 [Nephila pilipes]
MAAEKFSTPESQKSRTIDLQNSADLKVNLNLALHQNILPVASIIQEENERKQFCCSKSESHAWEPCSLGILIHFMKTIVLALPSFTNAFASLMEMVSCLLA